METMNEQDGSLAGSPGLSHEQLGRQTMAAWLTSGKSMEQFCKDAGVSYWSLRRWRLDLGEEFGLKIRRRPGAVGKRTKPSRASSADQTVRSKLAPIRITEAPAAQSSSVEIRLRGGSRALLVDASVDTQWLSRLLVLVEAAA